MIPHWCRSVSSGELASFILSLVKGRKPRDTNKYDLEWWSLMYFETSRNGHSLCMSPFIYNVNVTKRIYIDRCDIVLRLRS